MRIVRNHSRQSLFTLLPAPHAQLQLGPLGCFLLRRARSVELITVRDHASSGVQHADHPRCAQRFPSPLPTLSVHSYRSFCIRNRPLALDPSRHPTRVYRIMCPPFRHAGALMALNVAGTLGEIFFPGLIGMAFEAKLYMALSVLLTSAQVQIARKHPCKKTPNTIHDCILHPSNCHFFWA
jgi:hypothetical protein